MLTLLREANADGSPSQQQVQSQVGAQGYEEHQQGEVSVQGYREQGRVSVQAHYDQRVEVVCSSIGGISSRGRCVSSSISSISSRGR